ncbi:MAG: hypothetical protein ACR2H3_09915 [Acidimicrobiales bacterium]
MAYELAELDLASAAPTSKRYVLRLLFRGGELAAVGPTGETELRFETFDDALQAAEGLTAPQAKKLIVCLPSEDVDATLDARLRIAKDAAYKRFRYRVVALRDGDALDLHRRGTGAPKRQRGGATPTEALSLATGGSKYGDTLVLICP